jgi:HK97 gp10 family phage protein
MAKARTGSKSEDEREGVIYAWYQEMGTRKMAAHPYIRPALEQVTGESGIVELVAKQWKALWKL